MNFFIELFGAKVNKKKNVFLSKIHFKELTP
jgi:hypothetical protein